MNKYKGKFVNAEEGFKLGRPVSRSYFKFFTKMVYPCTMDPENPLTYVTDGDETQYRTRPKLSTDMGTTPYLTRLLFPKDQYLLSYLLHDDICEMGGLYVKLPGEDEFRFTLIGRFAGNQMLRQMVIAEGCGPKRSWLIKLGTDGAAAWSKVAPKEPSE